MTNREWLNSLSNEELMSAAYVRETVLRKYEDKKIKSLLDTDETRQAEIEYLKKERDNLNKASDEEFCDTMIIICGNPEIKEMNGDCFNVECQECRLRWLKLEHKDK